MRILNEWRRKNQTVKHANWSVSWYLAARCHAMLLNGFACEVWESEMSFHLKAIDRESLLKHNNILQLNHIGRQILSVERISIWFHSFHLIKQTCAFRRLHLERKIYEGFHRRSGAIFTFSESRYVQPSQPKFIIGQHSVDWISIFGCKRKQMDKVKCFMRLAEGRKTRNSI